MSITDEDYIIFVNLCYQQGLDDAIRTFTKTARFNETELRDLEAEYRRRTTQAEDGYPPKIYALPNREPWYAGPQPNDRFWPALKAELEASGRLPPDELARWCSELKKTTTSKTGSIGSIATRNSV